jgi:hypothetical protein
LLVATRLVTEKNSVTIIRVTGKKIVPTRFAIIKFSVAIALATRKRMPIETPLASEKNSVPTLLQLGKTQ